MSLVGSPLMLPPDPSVGRICLCVVTHVPKPLMMHRHHIWTLADGGPDTEENQVWLCPNAHTTTHECLRLLKKNSGIWAPPPGFAYPNRYSFMLAERGYDAWVTSRAA